MQTPTIRKLQELIESSDLPSLQQNVLKGKVERLFTQEETKHQLENKIKDNINEGHKKSIIDFYQVDENYIIYKTKNDCGGDDIEKYPFLFSTFNLKTNSGIGEVSNDFETQMLVTLKNKYLGLNSDFPYLVCRMLGKIN